MVNYYEELKLDLTKSISEINTELTELERVWHRREVQAPEKARKKLLMIADARKVFATDSSRAEYDRALAQSKVNPASKDPNQTRSEKFQKCFNDARSFFDSRQYDLAKASIDRAIGVLFMGL